MKTLAYDARKKSGGGPVRLAWSHNHSDRSRATAVDETLSRVICDQLLTNELLNSVGCLGRRQGIVADHEWKRQPGIVSENGCRTCEDETRTVARCFESIKERTRSL